MQIEICRMQKRELRKKKNEAHGWAGLERKGETSAKLEKTRSSCPLDCGFADGPDTERPDLDGLPIRTYLTSKYSVGKVCIRISYEYMEASRRLR